MPIILIITFILLSALILFAMRRKIMSEENGIIKGLFETRFEVFLTPLIIK